MDVDCCMNSAYAFVAFCLAASGIYCLNDVMDAESDRKHKEKSKRPVASGKVNKGTAYCIMAVCWTLAFGTIAMGCRGNMALMGKAVGILLAYIIMNIAYCMKLKHFAIVDVLLIAVGFVMRVLLGGVVTGIELSQWLVLMTFLLALFIAFAKRRDDVMTYENSGEKMRNNVNRYNIAFINQMLCILASVTIVCYIMYTVTDEVVERIGSHYIYTTSIFVIAGVMRYLQIVIVDDEGGSPTKLMLHDHFIQTCVVAWLITFACFLYL